MAALVALAPLGTVAVGRRQLRFPCGNSIINNKDL